MYSVLHSLAPSMPLNLMVTTNNSTSVTLTWEQPAMRNGNIQNYVITILDDNMNIVQNLTMSDSPSVITDLTPNTDYVVNVSAVTIRSGDAALTTFTTPACKHMQYPVLIIIVSF